MRLTTLSPFGQPRNMRELVVRLLAERPSLTFRQLRNAVRNLGRPGPRSYTVPATNNVTENAIGPGEKLRAKRMRGFKRHHTIIPC